MAGLCALAALNEYNKTGVISSFNMSVNVTTLTTQFLQGHPNLTIVNATSLPNAIIGKPEVHCVITPSFNASIKASSNNQRVIMCVAKGSPPRNNGNKLVHFNITLPNRVTKGPEVIFIPANTPGTTVFLIKNNTLYVVNSANSTSIRLLPKPRPVSMAYDPTIDSPSSNWVGYSIRNCSIYGCVGPITSVEGSWRVQPALSSANKRVAAQWVGIGGFNPISKTLVQIGTVSCFNATLLNPTTCRAPFPIGPTYTAWLETLPLMPAIIPIPINQNDIIDAAVSPLVSTLIINSSNNTAAFGSLWFLGISDQSNNQSFGITLPFVGYMDSGEWIDERPALSCINDCNYYSFTNFVNASFLFGGYSSTLTGLNIVPINRFYDYRVNMTNYFGNSSISSGLTDVKVATPNFGLGSLTVNLSAFIVHNFRIGKLVANVSTISQGNSYKINPETNYTANQQFPNALGGTGLYMYQWFEDKGNGYFTSTDCNIFVLALSGGTNCAVYSAQSGTYTFKLQVRTIGGPLTETVNSTPITITVLPVKTSIPITITNNQGSTSAPFQQMIRVDSASIHGINQNWNNVEFTTGQNATGSQLQAWVESGAINSSTDTVVWVKFPGGLPSGTTTIYMDMMPNPVMSTSGPTGEAPQLSPTYAQYDNGQNVFNFYDNFAGTSLDSNWATETASLWSGSAATPTYSVNDGFSSSTNGGTVYGMGTVPLGSVVDAYGTYGLTGIGFAHFDGISDLKFNASFWQAQESGSAVYGTLTSLDGCCQRFTSRYGGAPLTGVFSMYLTNPSSATYQLNYTDAQTLTVSPSLPYPEHIVLITDGNNGQLSGSFFNQWIRVRSAPPGGIMPAVTVDPLNSSVTISTTTTTPTTTSSVSTTSVFVTVSTSSSTTSSTTTIA